MQYRFMAYLSFEDLILITLPKIPKYEQFRIKKTDITYQNEEFIFLLGQEKALLFEKIE